QTFTHLTSPLTRIGKALRSRELPWRRCRPAQLLIVAAIFHLVLTITVFSLGRLHVLPRTFDERGIAISFAPDSAVFRDGAAGLSPTLRRGEILHWLIGRQPFHLKLNSSNRIGIIAFCTRTKSSKSGPLFGCAT